MKKGVAILLALALLVAAAGVYAGWRWAKRGTDVIGVTSLTKKNAVIMNSASGTEFVSGVGLITVGAGGELRVEYALEAGSFDLAFHAGSVGPDVFEAADMAALPAEGEVFGQSGVTGRGRVSFEAAGGEYTVYFLMHGAVGTAKVTAR